MITCYCGSDTPFANCCEPIVRNFSAQTAEQLMRSRYSAFVLNNTDYLLRSLHPSKHQANEKSQLNNAMQTRWLSLRVLNAEEDTVEFVAFFAAQNGLGQLHEKSHFIFEAGHWFYLDGKILPSIKLQRNDACPCGSGQKYKSVMGVNNADITMPANGY